MVVMSVASKLQTASRLLFSRYLLATNTVICGGLLSAGDVITQNIEILSDKNQKYDYRRTGYEPVRAGNALDIVKYEANLKCPNRILATNLRKHRATISQANLDGETQSLVKDIQDRELNEQVEFLNGTDEADEVPFTGKKKAKTGRMFCMGFLMGPFNHLWYKILDKYLPGKTGRIVVKKILADQAVAAPFFCSAFFFGMSLLEGKTAQEGAEEVKNKFLFVYIMDWCIWPPAQFINFYFLPSHLRVAYVSILTLFWNTIASWVKHRETVPLFGK